MKSVKWMLLPFSLSSKLKYSCIQILHYWRENRVTYVMNFYYSSLSCLFPSRFKHRCKLLAQNREYELMRMKLSVFDNKSDIAEIFVIDEIAQSSNKLSLNVLSLFKNRWRVNVDDCNISKVIWTVRSSNDVQLSSRQICGVTSSRMGWVFFSF